MYQRVRVYYLNRARRCVEYFLINVHCFAGRIDHCRPNTLAASANDGVAHRFCQVVFLRLCIRKTALKRFINALLIVFQAGIEISEIMH